MISIITVSHGHEKYIKKRVLEISCQSDKIISRIDNERRSRI